jgi:hypothetical protein
MSDTELNPDSQKTLYRDAVAAFEQLKRNHRDSFRADPMASREVVRKASARVFRLKPGPKPERNPRIARAARKRGRGAPWRELCPAFIEGWADLNEFTRGQAEDGFRRQVNDYLRNRPRLKFPKATPTKISAGTPGP